MKTSKWADSDDEVPKAKKTKKIKRESDRDKDKDEEKKRDLNHASSNEEVLKARNTRISLYANSPSIFSCRSVDCFKKLNRIDEGTYGIVYRAEDLETGEIVALKKLKLEREREGFPITSLREIHTLTLAKHKHVVNLREIVVGSTMDR